MKGCSFVFAGSGLSGLDLASRIVEVKSLGWVVSEEDVDHLLGVVDCVVALEVQKSCRTAHGADRSNKGNALAGIKNGACRACLDSDI